MRPLLLLLLANITFYSFAADLSKDCKELLKNENFGVTYCISNDTITIKVEDFKDFERNSINTDYSARITVDWFKKGETFFIKQTGYDGCIFEFDFNHDGKIGVGDKGFYMHGMEGGKTRGTAYFTSGAFRPMAQFKLQASIELFSFSILQDSKFVLNNNLGFSKDFYPNSSNMIYELRIPIEEIMDAKSATISFRIIVDRASEKILPGVDYKTIVLPLGQDAFYDEDDRFFQVDLAKSELKGVKELLEKQRQNRESVEQKRAEFAMLRKLISTEKLKNAKKALPKFDGFYLETTNGLFVEVPKQPCYYCKILNKEEGTSFLISKLSRQLYNPYYSEVVFDSLKYIQIEIGKIRNLWIMSGGELKKTVDLLTIHEIKKFSLYPLNGGQNILFKEPPSSNEWHGGILKNENFYWFENPKIELTREVGDGFFYRYLPVKPLKESTLYGVWAGRNIWVFETIPNKTITKPKVK